MAEVSNDILKKTAKLESIKDFKARHNITSQAIDYAINNDLVDYIQVGKMRLIALTKKTKAYEPNHDKRRSVDKKAA